MLKSLMARVGAAGITLPALEASEGAQDQATVLQSMAFGEVHEVWAEAVTDYAAAMACLLTSIKDSDKPVLWVTSREMVREHGLPYGPGLSQLGLAPERIILVQAHKPLDALWAMEEGLKTDAFDAVVGECTMMDLTASRRLTLAAQTHGSRCLLLVRSREAPSSAAHSRFRVSPDTSHEALFDAHAPGQARGRIDLVKHRGGIRPFSIIMEWPTHAQNYLSMAATLADRPLAQGAGEPMRASG